MMTVYELWGGKSSGGKIFVYVNDFLKICTTLEINPTTSP